jgi:hypothetical protein
VHRKAPKALRVAGIKNRFAEGGSNPGKTIYTMTEDDRGQLSERDHRSFGLTKSSRIEISKQEPGKGVPEVWRKNDLDLTKIDLDRLLEIKKMRDDRKRDANKSTNDQGLYGLTDRGDYR